MAWQKHFTATVGGPVYVKRRSVRPNFMEPVGIVKKKKQQIVVACHTCKEHLDSADGICAPMAAAAFAAAAVKDPCIVRTS